MREALTTFHLLRPAWLLALIPLAAGVIFLIRQQSVEVKWSGIIAPHLLQSLIVRPDQTWRFSPLALLAAGLSCGIVALSGPAWRREMPPFVEDKAPLMIALALSASMSRIDIAPSRIERAKQKIRDLLDLRANARTGLIGYAGSAHLVMPPTDDRAVIEPFLAALVPGLITEDGHDAIAAVAMGRQGLSSEPVPGTILLVADTLDGSPSPALRQSAGRNGLLMLRLDRSAASNATLGRDAVDVTLDDTDLNTLERRIETHYQAAQGDAYGTRWRDEGYWLIIPVALVSLLWFRRGVAVAWAVAVLLTSHIAPVRAAEVDFRSLWLTPDQQGRLAFDRGDYRRAATLFADPMWRGIAFYRAYDFLAAAEAFQKIDSTDGRFAVGNAQAQNHAYEKAIKAYDEVLKARPGDAATKINKGIVEAALKAREERRRKQENQDAAPPDLAADETKIDPDQHGGKRIQVAPDDLTTTGAAEAWMRQVQTTPADFLKMKFAIQSAAPPPVGGPR